MELVSRALLSSKAQLDRLLIAFCCFHLILSHPSLCVSTAKVDNPRILILVNQDIRISPDNAGFIQAVHSFC